METHSSFKYWPSCGMINECVISKWGASAKSKTAALKGPRFRETLDSADKKQKTLESVFASYATLKFSSCPCSALVLIPYLQTNPALIPGKCSAKPADMNVISAPPTHFFATLIARP